MYKPTIHTSIPGNIYRIRGQQVMLDRELATLYGVPTKSVNLAVKRNSKRFPGDFMFQLTSREISHLRFQSETSSWGGHRYRPYAFTEEGVAMLSSVLRSARAADEEWVGFDRKLDLRHF